jgi:hypothetical protein
MAWPAQAFPAGDADSLQALLAHGRMLHDLLPVTDRLVKALIAMPSLERQEAVRRVVLARQAESEGRPGNSASCSTRPRCCCWVSSSISGCNFGRGPGRCASARPWSM